MDDEALVGIAAGGTVKLKSSGSKMSERDRLMAMRRIIGPKPAVRRQEQQRFRLRHAGICGGIVS
jgi:hypothetical protein